MMKTSGERVRGRGRWGRDLKTFIAFCQPGGCFNRSVSVRIAAHTFSVVVEFRALFDGPDQVIGGDAFPVFAVALFQCALSEKKRK